MQAPKTFNKEFFRPFYGNSQNFQRPCAKQKVKFWNWGPTYLHNMTSVQFSLSQKSLHPSGQSYCGYGYAEEARSTLPAVQSSAARHPLLVLSLRGARSAGRHMHTALLHSHHHNLRATRYPTKQIGFQVAIAFVWYECDCVLVGKYCMWHFHGCSATVGRICRSLLGRGSSIRLLFSFLVQSVFTNIIGFCSGCVCFQLCLLLLVARQPVESADYAAVVCL